VLAGDEVAPGEAGADVRQAKVVAAMERADRNTA
jgi:hypothetical protein